VDIIKNEMHHYSQVHNIYRPVHLCRSCQNVYFVIDSERTANHKEIVSDKQLKSLIRDYFKTPILGKAIAMRLQDSKEIYSHI